MEIPQPKVYVTNIEKTVIEFISSARQDITIAMAWFTNKDIINSIVEKRQNTPGISIKVLIDRNFTNQKYFLPYRELLLDSGIDVFINKGKFLHDKFVTIDSEIFITGSYNFSKKANSNRENMISVESKELAKFYNRIFASFISDDYFDANIHLLLKNETFSRSLLSTYYPFSKKEALKYKDKILVGECFTAENGLYDELHYCPGIIFNNSFKYYGELESNEFGLPIDKKVIKKWTELRNEELIIESYRDAPDYDGINEELENNSTGVAAFFKRKFSNIHSVQKLEELIAHDVDIIIEDDLWQLNFEPFVSKKIVERLFNQFPPIEKNLF